MWREKKTKKASERFIIPMMIRYEFLIFFSRVNELALVDAKSVLGAEFNYFS